MNAAARTISQGNLFRGDLSHLLKGSNSLLMIFLWVAVIISALSVVYVKHLERYYTHEISQVSYQNQQLEIQQAQMLLEKGMWAAPDRIRTLAKHRLNMQSSIPKAVIVIKK